MSTRATRREWPPVPGDFEVRNSAGSVALCTLGKKIDVDAEYAIIGTCKTENIGIERMVVNTISNPKLRFFVVAGPEVPGHKTGSSIRSLFAGGVDPKTRRIAEAEGAIPYLENVPLEAIDRFRSQLELIDMIDVVDAASIAETVGELERRNPGPFSEEAMWLDYGRRAATKARLVTQTGDISVIPEYGLVLDLNFLLLHTQQSVVVVATHPSRTVVEPRAVETGTVLFVREE